MKGIQRRTVFENDWGSRGRRQGSGRPVFHPPDSSASVPTALGRGRRDVARNSDNCASEMLQPQRRLLPKHHSGNRGEKDHEES